MLCPGRPEGGGLDGRHAELFHRRICCLGTGPRHQGSRRRQRGPQDRRGGPPARTLQVSTDTEPQAILTSIKSVLCSCFYLLKLNDGENT